MTKDEIIAKLEEAGIEHDGRWSKAKLEALLPGEDIPEPVLVTEAVRRELVTCRVVRDFWPSANEDDRVRKGQIIELTPMDAIDAIEAGAVERVR